jgi:alanyl-tRNA synthetase
MDIRKAFIEFFEEKNHKRHESSPLVPQDASLLFTNAGMVQFKDIFTGERPIPENPRATSSQTCIRAGGKHNDLENVGYTARHHTFFEMLGNFSFGDYFKKDAIDFGWEFVTEVLKLPEEKLYATVHTTDDEAFELWQKYLPKEKIKRLGDSDNFWQMGDTGPCGPSSEIFYDQGKENFNTEEDYLGGDGDRFLEIWNLVFMQYDRDKSGKLTPLPKPSIDTGMGLERITAIKEGKINNYHSSLFMPYISKIEQLLSEIKIHKKYDFSQKESASFRVIADHIRGISFLLAQGVRFDREGRGYVARRILRRAIRHGYILGFRKPFLHKIVDTVVEVMGTYYTYLLEEKERIKKAILSEEERFFETIESGMKLFEEELSKTKTDTFNGEVAFKLYDTFGFPLDLTQDMLREKNMKVDVEKFNFLMSEQKKRAKANWKGSGDATQTGDFKAILEKFGENSFIGYDLLISDAKILAVLDSNFKLVDKLESNQTGWIFLNKTPFYAESGGQSGDSGTIYEQNGEKIAKVIDTQKFIDLNLSQVKITENNILFTNQEVKTEIDSSRKEIAKHHSATHLLHAVLRNVLGDEVSQAGSLVQKDRLRFDFTFNSSVSVDNLRDIEQKVNKIIFNAVNQETKLMNIDEAKKSGAMALFGEKYSDDVRVVSFETESVELCGGTHVLNTAEIGTFLILKESGVSAGVRRIEAIVGKSAYDYISEQRENVEKTALLLKTNDLVSGTEKLLKQVKELKAEVKNALNSIQKDLNITEINGITTIVDIFENGDIKEQIDKQKNKYDKVAIMLFQPKGEKVVIACGSKNSNIKAGNWIKEVAPVVGGGGGGRPDFAQAGGKNSSKIDEAIKKSKEYLQQNI